MGLLILQGTCEVRCRGSITCLRSDLLDTSCCPLSLRGIHPKGMTGRHTPFLSNTCVNKQL